MRKFINLKNTLILFVSVIILGACSSNDSFEIYPSGYILQENSIVEDSIIIKSFTPYITVVSIYNMNQVSVKQGSSTLFGKELDESVWRFMGESTLNLESLNRTYTATASDDNDNIDVKEVIFNFKNEHALGALEISKFTFDGSKVMVEGKEVENAVYYGIGLCVGEEKEGVYNFPELNWQYYRSNTSPQFTNNIPLSNYSAGQEIRVAIIAIYQNITGDIILRSSSKTIKVGKTVFLEDEIAE